MAFPQHNPLKKKKKKFLFAEGGSTVVTTIQEIPFQFFTMPSTRSSGSEKFAVLYVRRCRGILDLGYP